MEGRGSREESVPMLDRAAVMVAAVILAMAAFMAIVGRAMGSAEDLRLAGMGIPALAHMAAALALAISNNCSLSRSLMRCGLPSGPLCLRGGDRFLRRMRTGERLGSLFQRSLWLYAARL